MTEAEAYAILNFWGSETPTTENSVLVIEIGGIYTADGKPFYSVAMYLQKMNAYGRCVCSPIRHNDCYGVRTIDDLVDSMNTEVEVWGFPPVHGISFRGYTCNNIAMKKRIDDHREDVKTARAVLGIAA